MLIRISEPYFTSLFRINLHLTIFTIKLQTETLTIGSQQVIRFPIRRTPFLESRTPAHTISQAMLAKHQDSTRNSLFLIGRSHGSNAVVSIKKKRHECSSHCRDTSMKFWKRLIYAKYPEAGKDGRSVSRQPVPDGS